MISFLNKAQLAFVLDIKVEDARAKMCVAWCRSKKITNQATTNSQKKIVDDYPPAMPVDMLSKELGLPWLQGAVDDIENNYLTRPASKKWILCDYPERAIMLQLNKGKNPKALKISIPPPLRSMLPEAVVTEIKKEWSKRYGV